MPACSTVVDMMINQNGICMLKNGKMKARASGSGSLTVTPDGKIVTKKQVYEQNQCRLSPAADQKPAGKNQLSPGSGNGSGPGSIESIGNNPGKGGQTEKTEETEDQSSQAAGNSGARTRSYTLNKRIIRARLGAYIGAMKKPVLHLVTISFPKNFPDELGYQALNTWLTVCRQQLHLKEYLWIAERQQNGTIHYHVLVPQFLNIVKANRAMMVIISTFIRKGKFNWNIHAAKRYNGIDISKPWKDKAKKIRSKTPLNFAAAGNHKALAYYVTKYITKNDGQFYRLAWHCSRGFTAMFTKLGITAAEARLMDLSTYIDRRKKREDEFFDFWPWQGKTCWVVTELLRCWNYYSVNKELLPIREIPRGLYPFIGRDHWGKKIAGAWILN